jgi:uncharacterized membrane protein YcaP (DUF421 family)
MMVLMPLLSPFVPRVREKEVKRSIQGLHASPRVLLLVQEKRVLFTDWWSLLRVLVVGVLAYASLVLMLRISGKRTLSKMNAFDLIVTVALGSTLAAAFLTPDVALADALLALAILIGMQYLVATLSVRYDVVRRLVKSEPTLLMRRGEFLHSAMRRERVIEEELLAAIRSSGMTHLQDVEAVVLETDGSFTVLPCAERPNPDALRNVGQGNGRQGD